MSIPNSSAVRHTRGALDFWSRYAALNVPHTANRLNRLRVVMAGYQPLRPRASDVHGVTAIVRVLNSSTRPGGVGPGHPFLEGLESFPSQRCLKSFVPPSALATAACPLGAFNSSTRGHCSHFFASSSNLSNLRVSTRLTKNEATEAIPSIGSSCAAHAARPRRYAHTCSYTSTAKMRVMLTLIPSEISWFYRRVAPDGPAL